MQRIKKRQGCADTKWPACLGLRAGESISVSACTFISVKKINDAITKWMVNVQRSVRNTLAKRLITMV